VKRSARSSSAAVIATVMNAPRLRPALATSSPPARQRQHPRRRRLTMLGTSASRAKLSATTKVGLHPCRRNHPMRPVGRVPYNFLDQVYLVPSNFSALVAPTPLAIRLSEAPLSLALRSATIRYVYDTRFYFNVRPKADIIPHVTKTKKIVKRKKKQKRWMYSEVSVTVQGVRGVNPEEEKECCGGKGFAEKVLSLE